MIEKRIGHAKALGKCPLLNALEMEVLEPTSCVIKRVKQFFTEEVLVSLKKKSFMHFYVSCISVPGHVPLKIL